MKQVLLAFLACALLALALPRSSTAQAVADKKVYPAVSCQFEHPDFTPGAVPAGWTPPTAFATGDSMLPPFNMVLGAVNGPSASVLAEWNIEVLRFWCPVVRDATAVGGVPTLAVRTIDSSATSDVRCAAWATPPTGAPVVGTPAWVSTGTAFAAGPKTISLVLPSIGNGASVAIACEMRSSSGDMSGLSILSYAVTESGSD